MQMLAAERAEVLRIRDAGEVDHEVLDQVLGALDVEESMLDRIERHATSGRATGRCCPRSRPAARASTCADAPDARRSPATPAGLRGLPARGHHAGCTCGCA